jgi:hypothetical protein
VEAYSEGKFMLKLTAYMDEAWHSEDPALHFVGWLALLPPSKTGRTLRRNGTDTRN